MMAIKLERYAQRVAPGVIQVNYSGTLDARALALSDWEIRTSDGTSAFATDSDVTISSVTSPDAGESAIEFTIDISDAIYERFYYLIRYTGIGGYVDSSNDTCYGQEYVSDLSPFHLVIEGGDFVNHSILADGMVIPYQLIDQDNLPESISQEISAGRGISNDGGIDLTFADIDNTLTTLLSPNQTSPLTTLTADIDPDTSGTITVYATDTTDFPSSGYIEINRESFYYASKTSTQFSFCVRDTGRTVQGRHRIGDSIFGFPSAFVGRACWLEDNSGDKLYSGIISKVSPTPGNIASYSMSIDDVKTALDVDVSIQAASAKIGQYLLITTENNGLRFVSPNGGIVEFDLTPGIYTYEDGDSDSLGPRNIARAIFDAFINQLSGSSYTASLYKVTISGSVIQLNFSTGIVEDGYTITGSMLPTLGYDDSILRFADYDVEIVQNTTVGNVAIEADDPIRVCPHNSTSIAIHADDTDSLDGNSFPTDSVFLVRIDDEIIAVSKFIYGGESITTTLATAISSTTSQLVNPADTDGFKRYDFIKIDNEVMMIVNDIDTSNSFTVYRGVNGTTAATHALVGTTITRLSYSKLTGCRRGYYSTTPEAHDPGTQVDGLITSDSIGGVVFQNSPIPSNPIRFIGQAVGYDPKGVYLPYWSLRLSDTDSIDTDAFDEEYSRFGRPSDPSFLSILEADDSFRDRLEQICTAAGVYIYANDEGKLSIRGDRATLLSDTSTGIIEASDIIELNSIDWAEDSRVNRVVFKYDKSYQQDELKTELRIEDSRVKSKIWRPQTHARIIEAVDFHGQFSTVRRGNYAGFVLNYVDKMFALYNQFLYSVELSVKSSLVPAIEIGSSVQLTHPSLPDGSGSRGISSGIFSVIAIDKGILDGVTLLRLIRRPAGRYSGFSVAANVKGWASGPKTLTLSRVDKNGVSMWVNSDTPDKYFFSGGSYQIVYKNGSGTMTSAQFEIDGSVPSSWTVDNFDVTSDTDLTSYAITDESYVIPDNWGNLTSVQDTLKLFAFIADSSGKLGPANDDGFVYVY